MKGIFLALIVFYLIQLGLQFSGADGISLTSSNSLLRVILNEAIRFSSILVFWFAVMFMTKDAVACTAAIVIKAMSLIYIRSLFLYTSDLSQEEIMALMDKVNAVRIIANITAYSVFGLLHFKRLKGLLLLFVWLIVYGITSGAVFTTENSYLNTLLKLFDLDQLFYFKLKTEAGGIKYVDLLSPFYTQLYLLFDFLIFWFVYTLIKAGKSFDLSLRTIQLNPIINQLTFSLIYWPLRILLFIAAFGVLGLAAGSFQREAILTVLMQIAAACFSIFVTGSLYRNLLTDYLVSKGRSPGWLYLFLNVPIVSFFAWIYTFFIPSKSSFTLSPYSNIVAAQDQSMDISEIDTPTRESSKTEELDTAETNEPTYEGPDVYYLHPLQTYFAENERNITIKIVLIFFSIGLFLWQFNNVNLGIGRSGSGWTESSIIMAVVTIALTIWYMFDWRAMLPLFFIQCFGLFNIVFFQMQGHYASVAGAGLINLMVYYSLFHFDHLKLKNPIPFDTKGIN